MNKNTHIHVIQNALQNIHIIYFIYIATFLFTIIYSIISMAVHPEQLNFSNKTSIYKCSEFQIRYSPATFRWKKKTSILKHSIPD